MAAWIMAASTLESISWKVSRTVRAPDPFLSGSAVRVVELEIDDRGADAMTSRPVLDGHLWAGVRRRGQHGSSNGHPRLECHPRGHPMWPVHITGAGALLPATSTSGINRVGLPALAATAQGVSA
jgi:hypothetical protein